MAKPTTLAWYKLSLWVGDGVSPVEDFTRKSCGLTSHTFGIRGTVTEVDVPDCDNPEDPVWLERTIRSLSGDVAGAGVLAVENFPFFRDWSLSGLFKNCRVVLQLPVSPGYFAARYVLSTWEIVGTNEDGKIRLNLNFQSDGEVAWQVGAP
jgi:Phage tail tube protein